MSELALSTKRFRVWDGERMHDLVPPVNPVDHVTVQPLGDGTLHPWTRRDWSDQSARFTRERIYVGAVLLQSTGLHDAGGAEVYEGDVIETAEGRCVVEFRHGAWGAREVRRGIWLSFGEELSEEALYRVVGNVFENPDLLDL